MPHLKELHSRYKDQGLVLIGVHTERSAEGMAEFVKGEFDRLGIPRGYG
ncbi:MAG: hypothetical protein IH851_10590 [Armatimonadetes bacterium]|nr:hypothetical protein [Armatimonadota bacterium]